MQRLLEYLHFLCVWNLEEQTMKIIIGNLNIKEGIGWKSTVGDMNSSSDVFVLKKEENVWIIDERESVASRQERSGMNMVWDHVSFLLA